MRSSSKIAPPKPKRARDVVSRVNALAAALVFGAVSLGANACSRSATLNGDGSTSLAPPARNGERKGVAVVELFTSEGCSSCPAAEEVFDQLAQEARANGESIFPVAFHVDYWDEIGWKDPFSSARFTSRQLDYAHAWGRTSMYTPEAIVDGQDEMVGSDDAGLRAAIARALDRPAMVGVTVQRAPSDDARTLVADVALTSTPSDAYVVVALVERDLTIDVKSGENAGRTLHHTNVVRALESVAPASHAQVRVVAPQELRLDHAALVAWVQRTKDARIVGASAIDLQ